MEASKLLNETITLKLEIENLKTTINKQMKQLTTLKEELKEVETSSSEKEKFLEAEVVKLSNTIKDAKRQSNESKGNLGKELIDRDETIQALQKKVTQINLIHESTLSHHQKELLDKDQEFATLLNNINKMNKQNIYECKKSCQRCDSNLEHGESRTQKQCSMVVEHISPDRVTFQCELCDKRYSSKPHLDSHIATKHQNLRYNCKKCKYKTEYMSNLRKHKCN